MVALVLSSAGGHAIFAQQGDRHFHWFDVSQTQAIDRAAQRMVDAVGQAKGEQLAYLVTGTDERVEVNDITELDYHLQYLLAEPPSYSDDRFHLRRAIEAVGQIDFLEDGTSLQENRWGVQRMHWHFYSAGRGYANGYFQEWIIPFLFMAGVDMGDNRHQLHIYVEQEYVEEVKLLIESYVGTKVKNWNLEAF